MGLNDFVFEWREDSDGNCVGSGGGVGKSGFCLILFLSFWILEEGIVKMSPLLDALSTSLRGF